MPPALRIAALASGSSGNAYYVETPEGALLVDCGLSGKRIAAGVARIGGSLEHVRGVLVSHDHGDHVRGGGVLARRHGFPLLMTEGTWAASRGRLGRVGRVEGFRAGGRFRVAGLEVTALGTSHDGAEPVAFVLERAGARAGILTDLGTVSAEVRDLLPALDAVFLEANYDPHLLETGPYPKHLQRRIRSARGHLSNGEAGALLAECAGERLRSVVLAHLSENNNTPAVALETVRDLAGARLAALGADLFCAPRHEPSPVLELGPRPDASGPTGRPGDPSR